MRNEFFIIRLSSTPKELLGPISISSIFQALEAGDLSWTDIGYQAGQPWQRLFEISALRMLMPEIPASEKLEKYSKICAEHAGASPVSDTPTGEGHPSEKLAVPKTRPAPAGPAPLQRLKPSSTLPPRSAQTLPPRFTPVYLQVNGVEHGPINSREARKLLQTLKAREQIYIWYRGLKTWIPVQEIPEFADLSFTQSKLKPLPPELNDIVYSRENRSANRQVVVATSRQLNEDGQAQAFGVCLNISVSGMQLRLEEPHALKDGDTYRFEILPLSLMGLGPLLLEAKVVWQREDGNRIGLAFTQFRGDDRQRLQKFLSRVEAQGALWKPQTA